MKHLRPVFAGILGLCAGLLVTFLAGENPWNVLGILARSAFGSWEDFGMSLFYATPLLLTGLAVAVPFHAGLFNIGAEGQLTLGALAAAAVGTLLPAVPWPLAPLMAGVAAFAVGGFWGFIPGWLRTRRGGHEVISTIMLNFIAAGLASWVTLYALPNPESQNPETSAIGEGYRILHLSIFGEAPVSTALFLALACAAATSFFLWRQVRGFELRAVGTNERAARHAGIDVARIRMLALFLGGGLAGLVGVAEVLGHAGRFKLGFSPYYGFTGIAVALLGKGNPLGIVISALLFGALHKGTADLDFETEHVSREISMILQALIILFVAADGIWDRWDLVKLRIRKGGRGG